MQCRDKVQTVVVDNPIEECDMEPIKTCKSGFHTFDNPKIAVGPKSQMLSNFLGLHFKLNKPSIAGTSPSWSHASWQLRTVLTSPKKSAQGQRSTQGGSGSQRSKSGVTRSRTKGSWFRNLLCLHWSVKMTLTALQATPVSPRRASVAPDQEK